MISAKNRDGELFFENEEVLIKDGYNKYCSGRIFVIDQIIHFEECESGYMISSKDKETGKLLKRKLDTNWFLKIKN